MTFRKIVGLNKIKGVKYKQPHFSWPEKDLKIGKKISNYYLNLKNGKNGLPDIIEKLEKSFRIKNKSKYCLALSSGTAALHTAYLSINLKKGDEVIVSNYTFPATVVPLFLIGAKPILCDVDKNFANIDPDKVEKLITKKTKAITVTHWWGQPCKMDQICKIAKKYRLKLIEDCAHAPGAKFKNKNVGTFGDFGCFSLDNQKLLASGEGGILTTNNYDLYQRAILFSDFGPRLNTQIKIKKYKNFIQTGIGTKYRIHFIAAKIAFERLKNIKTMNLDRQNIFNYFSNKLKKSKILIPPKNIKGFKRGGFFGYKVVMKKNDKFVGFYEKEFHPSMKEVELINMGILKEYRGKKLGSLLLSHSIKKTFVIKPLRMWVHTCSLDHKYALQNYKSKGFKAFKEEVINFVA